MKIFSSAQLKDWDTSTIAGEDISSGQLMERAAHACYEWLLKQFTDGTFTIFCGKGNNGGDGLALARMLIEDKRAVSVYILESGKPGSRDFEHNLARLYTCSNDIHFIASREHFPQIRKGEIIIDALYGTGLNKAPGEIAGLLIQYLNQAGAIRIAIDVPSGLYIDKNSAGNKVIIADYTLTFQAYKLAFMMAENEAWFGKIVVLDINLQAKFYAEEEAKYEIVDRELIKALYRPRKPFSNKGDFGHACLLAGSYGMMGAGVLAARACLKSGVGKLTCAICKKGYEIIQISAPEAMCIVFGNTYLRDFDDQGHFSALGVGPGIGLHNSHITLLEGLFKNSKVPLIIDADALNTLSNNKELLSLLPPHTIIAPHPKEFEKLFGKSANDFTRLHLALEKSEEHNIHIILKGHHTLITTPAGKAYFNSTGNAGMAKGGSGDVLTGIVTGFAAQGYSLLEVCLLGVFLHGLAGDIAATRFSQEAMLASDIINCLGEAFQTLSN